MAQRRPGDSLSFDADYQPNILTPLQPPKIFKTFVPSPDEETPFKQRPRPPEADVESRLNSRTSFSQRLSSVIGYSNESSSGGAKASSPTSSLWRSSQPRRSSMKCKDVTFVVIFPFLLLSLVMIGVCVLFVYLHLLQVCFSR